MHAAPAFRSAVRPARLSVRAERAPSQKQNSKARGERAVGRAAATEAPPAPKQAREEELPSYVNSSDKYAVIEAGGVQHLVEENRLYTCNRLKAEPGSRIRFPRVLALKNDGKFEVGRPYLDNVRVEAQIVEDFKAPKIIVFKMRAKKHYRRKNGHRQPMSKFLITKILHD